MNIGSTGTETPVMVAIAGLKSALDTQTALVDKLLNPKSGQQPDLQTTTAAVYGKGQNLDLFV